MTPTGSPQPASHTGKGGWGSYLSSSTTLHASRQPAADSVLLLMPVRASRCCPRASGCFQHREQRSRSNCAHTARGGKLTHMPEKRSALRWLPSPRTARAAVQTRSGLVLCPREARGTKPRPPPRIGVSGRQLNQSCLTPGARELQPEWRLYRSHLRLYV